MNELIHISTWVTSPWFSSSSPNEIPDLGFDSILEINKKEKDKPV